MTIYIRYILQESSYRCVSAFKLLPHKEVLQSLKYFDLRLKQKTTRTRLFIALLLGKICFPYTLFLNGVLESTFIIYNLIHWHFR